MDLSTTYLGLQLKNPLVPSASPLMRKVDNIKRMEDTGAAAVVLHSLFEEEIRQASHEFDHYLNYGAESYWEALSYFPEVDLRIGPDSYLNHVRKVKAAVSIPVIASLNGVSTGGWIDYAKKIEDAGADALELNTYYLAAEPDQAGADVEQMYLDLVAELKASVHIPIAIKLGHQFSAFANMARRLDQAGANGLVLFNRFYEPDYDLESLEIVPDVRLSTPHELRIRLRWVAILYGRIKADLALTGGVHDARRCDQGRHGRREGGDDNLSALAARDPLPGDDVARSHHLDGRARVRIRPADAWQHEPARRGATGRARACELHACPAFLPAQRLTRQPNDIRTARIRGFCRLAGQCEKPAEASIHGVKAVVLAQQGVSCSERVPEDLLR